MTDRDAPVLCATLHLFSTSLVVAGAWFLRPLFGPVWTALPSSLRSLAGTAEYWAPSSPPPSGAALCYYREDRDAMTQARVCRHAGASASPSRVLPLGGPACQLVLGSRGLVFRAKRPQGAHCGRPRALRHRDAGHHDASGNKTRANLKSKKRAIVVTVAKLGLASAPRGRCKLGHPYKAAHGGGSGTSLCRQSPNIRGIAQAAGKPGRIPPHAS
jgi:hypothetical protein